MIEAIHDYIIEIEVSETKRLFTNNIIKRKRKCKRF